MNYSIGSCGICGGDIYVIKYTEKETKNGIETGRVRRSASHLECELCGDRKTVDDSFDGPWESNYRGL